MGTKALAALFAHVMWLNFEKKKKVSRYPLVRFVGFLSCEIAELKVRDSGLKINESTSLHGSTSSDVLRVNKVLPQMSRRRLEKEQIKMIGGGT